MTKETEQTIAAIKERAVPILTRHGATRAGLFGSLVRGEATDVSDIDLLVELPRTGLSLLDLARIHNELEGALERKVDLVEYDAIKPRIRERILAEEIRIL